MFTAARAIVASRSSTPSGASTRLHAAPRSSCSVPTPSRWRSTAERSVEAGRVSVRMRRMWRAKWPLVHEIGEHGLHDARRPLVHEFTRVRRGLHEIGRSTR